MGLEQEVELLRAANTELQELLAGNQERLQAALVQIVELQAQIVELEAQLRQAKKPASFVKANGQKTEGKAQPRKKRAAEHNRSRKRAVPTRIERHALERCPECDCRLSGESIDYTREVVELPEPQPVEVIEHQVLKRWCPHCEVWRSPHLDLSGQVLGQGRIGVRVAALVSYLRTTLRLPVRAIQEYLQSLHGLRLSIGEIVELLHGVGRALAAELAELQAEVRRSGVVHADETGWREDGQNGYIWVFSTPEGVRYYQYDHSRSHWVPQRMLGPDFKGYLASDFYVGYNELSCQHQRCWAHLLRDLHELKEAQAGNAEVIAWATVVGELYTQAQEWLAAHPEAEAVARQQQYIALVERLVVLGQRYARAPDHPCRVLAKRLLRHQDELFLFMLVKGLSADNNLAERSLRPLVIARKISGGSRSPQGSRTRMALASLFATWRARQLNPFVECFRHLSQAAPTPA